MLCGDVTLDVNAFVHLSRMPALSQLDFTLSPPLLNQTIPSNLPLSFPSLHEFVLYSICLDPISQLLSRIKLPAVMDFTAFIEHRPSQLDLSIFISTIRTSGIGHTIQGLQLDQGSKHILAEALKHVLCFQDLQPCTKFRILRRLNLNFEWHVELTDSELLMLASAWPHLEHLIINPDWGWKTQGGITPNGLVQLLKRCRALSQVALAIDTQGYTESPPPSERFGLTLPPTFSLDIVDSTIKEESVPAIAAFLACIAPCPKFTFYSWEGWFMVQSDDKIRWGHVYERANRALEQRS